MNTYALGLELLPRVFIDDNVYLFSQIRNFVWESPHKATKQYIDFCVRKKDIVRCDLYLDRFGWRNLAGHIILEFYFSSGETLALSVEARLPNGEKYLFWKGLLLQYPIVAIWGTSEDILGLRKVRKDILVHYTLRIQKRDLQLFFENVLKTTDRVNVEVVRYNLLLNNCTSLLWKVVSKTFGIKFWYWQIFLPGYLDRLLYQLKLISRKSYLYPEMI